MEMASQNPGEAAAVGGPGDRQFALDGESAG